MVAQVRGAVLAFVVGVCCGCGSATVDTSSAASQGSTPIELAESQISASTVAAPTPPMPCDPDEVELQAADPGIDADKPDQIGADQVIDVVNRGDLRCEVDVSGSPEADEDLEPNVVLGPGEVGHLWISEREGCEGTGSDPIDALELRINGVGRLVPLTFASTCGIELWAFFTD